MSLADYSPRFKQELFLLSFAIAGYVVLMIVRKALTSKAEAWPLIRATIENVVLDFSRSRVGSVMLSYAYSVETRITPVRSGYWPVRRVSIRHRN